MFFFDTGPDSKQLWAKIILESPSGVMVKAMNCGTVISEFELK